MAYAKWARHGPVRNTKQSKLLKVVESPAAAAFVPATPTRCKHPSVPRSPRAVGHVGPSKPVESNPKLSLSSPSQDQSATGEPTKPAAPPATPPPRPWHRRPPLAPCGARRAPAPAARPSAPRRRTSHVSTEPRTGAEFEAGEADQKGAPSTSFEVGRHG